MSEEVKETVETTEEVKASEPSKKRGLSESTIELITAILLGVTAILTAWAAWIGSLHGGNQATNYAQSNNVAADGNSRYNEAAQHVMQDMLLWNEISDLQLEIMYAEDIGDEDTANVAKYKLFYKCDDNLTEDMAAMLGWDSDLAYEYAVEGDVTAYVDEWMTLDEAVVSPFTYEGFEDAYYEDAMYFIDQSNELLAEGQKDNANGDAFNLVTVIYSVTLFLLGVVGLFKNIPNRTIVLVAAIVAFLVATIYMFTIPMPTGFSIFNFFG